MAEPDSFCPKLPVLTAGKILLLEIPSPFGSYCYFQNRVGICLEQKKIIYKGIGLACIAKI